MRAHEDPKNRARDCDQVARILQQVGRIERLITRRLALSRDMGWPAISLVKQGPMTVDIIRNFGHRRLGGNGWTSTVPTPPSENAVDG